VQEMTPTLSIPFQPSAVDIQSILHTKLTLPLTPLHRLKLPDPHPSPTQSPSEENPPSREIHSSPILPRYPSRTECLEPKKLPSFHASAASMHMQGPCPSTHHTTGSDSDRLSPHSLQDHVTLPYLLASRYSPLHYLSHIKHPYLYFFFEGRGAAWFPVRT
jgi:hypothetical protein